jgi:hypothetical protein
MTWVISAVFQLKGCLTQVRRNIAKIIRARCTKKEKVFVPVGNKVFWRTAKGRINVLIFKEEHHV